MNRGEKAETVLFAGNSHPELAKLIAERLCLKLANISVFNKSNRETSVEIGCSVRAKDVYIIQTGTKNVNNDLMELMIIAYACKTSAARNIIGVIPYLPYSKQSKMRKRGCIVSKLMATMMNKAGLKHIITLDVHQKEVQGFFNCPVDNLRASPFLIQYIQQSIPDFRNSVIVAHNANSVKRATSYAERLRLGIAVIHGEEKLPEEEKDDGRYSPPPEEEERPGHGPGPAAASMLGAHAGAGVFSFGLDVFPDMPAKAKPPMNVVGDVGGKIAILVDDMVDDVESYISAAELLKERGAYKVYVIATHGLLSGDTPRLLEKSCIDEVVVTNTVPHELQKLQCHKIRTVDISVLLCEAIRRIQNFESMSYLFTNIAQED